jgi:uncharacterized circularly permuted ATP-grasp superfamily protein
LYFQVLLDSENWQQIEASLLERTQLFNLLLKDIYGKQELIHQEVIPPETVFAHPGFLRPCFGIEHPTEHALILHAVDMLRTAENQVCVIGDRTQSPSGAGYALENRKFYQSGVMGFPLASVLANLFGLTLVNSNNCNP